MFTSEALDCGMLTKEMVLCTR